MSDAALLRCGDEVLHRPTGERWLVAWAEDEYLAPTGWANCRALVSDCDILRRCTDDEHRRSVMGWWHSGGGDSRRAKVLRLYAAAIERAAGGGDE